MEINSQSNLFMSPNKTKIRQTNPGNTETVSNSRFPGRGATKKSGPAYLNLHPALYFSSPTAYNRPRADSLSGRSRQGWSPAGHPPALLRQG